MITTATIILQVGTSKPIPESVSQLYDCHFRCLFGADGHMSPPQLDDLHSSQDAALRILKSRTEF